MSVAFPCRHAAHAPNTDPISVAGGMQIIPTTRFDECPQLDVICVPGGGTMLPFNCISDTKTAYFRMKGREVFNFAVSKGTEAIVKLLGKSGLTAEDVTCFICHQANVNILLEIAEQLKVNEEKFYMNLFRCGNTASASVLIALDEALRGGAVAPGDLVVTAAFGGGLSWGANLIRV